MSAGERRPAFTTAAELVRQRAEDDRTGLVFESRTWTWRQVVHEAELRACAPAQLRRPGPFHIGVLLENTDEYLFLLAGAALAGAVIVGINPTRRGDELAADIRVTDCQLLITDSTQRRLVDGLDLGVGPERILVSTDSEAYRSRLAHRGRARPALPAPAPDQLYLLIFTSGSTGGPKAVRMTQGRAARSAARVGFSPEDVLYSAMPLFHGNALSAAVLPAFSSGATLVLRRQVLGLVLPPRHPGQRGHLLQHAWAGPSPTSWPRRPPSTIATTGCATCWDPRPRPPTRPSSPAGSASR